MRMPLVKTFAIQDQSEKEKARAALFAEDGAITKWLGKLDKKLEDCPCTDVDIGHIYAFCTVNMLRQPTFIDGIPEGAINEYPNITRHHDWLAKLPPVLDYYKEKDGIRVTFKPLL